MTLNEILNSDLITEMIEQENRDLAEAGWTIKEVRAMAQFITDLNK